MYIIGGWLGSGPFAASDIYILDLHTLTWTQRATGGSSPGPCNMHSADLIGRILYIFRGGDGRDYLNDLHTFNIGKSPIISCIFLDFLINNIDSGAWKLLVASGETPPPRANHSSAVIRKYLYIFGGWDGSKRLNDLYRFDSGIIVILFSY